MINTDKGLLGQPMTTFHQEIRQQMSFKEIQNAFLGCAVKYRNEDLFIVNCWVEPSNYFSLTVNPSNILFILNDKSAVVGNDSDLSFYKSDENDEVENTSHRLTAIESEWRLYKLINKSTSSRVITLNAPRFDTLTTLADIGIKHNEAIDYYVHGLNNFLSIKDALQKVRVTHTTTTSKWTADIVDFKYNQRDDYDVSLREIKLHYSDIMIKIYGVSDYVPLTSSALEFVYQNKSYKFEQFLDMHNRGLIK